MESLPKACLQHPGYRQINYEAPNLLKKKPKPLASQLKWTSFTFLSLRLPSQPHDHASSRHMYPQPNRFFFIFSQTSQLCLLSSITFALFVAEMPRIAPSPLPGSKWAILSCKHPPLDRRKKKRKKTCDLSLRSVPKTIAYYSMIFDPLFVLFCSVSPDSAF